MLPPASSSPATPAGWAPADAVAGAGARPGTSADQAGGAPPRVRALPRHLLGGLLLLLASIPLYRLLADPRTGLAGASTVAQADATLAYALSGTALLLALGIGAGLLLRPAALERWSAGWAQLLCRPSTGVLALGLGLCAALLAALFNTLVLAGAPNLVDAMAQLVQARYLAQGRLAGPSAEAAFRLIPNMLLAPGGWASQYPPGQLLLLAAALRAGAPWAAGALAAGATAALMLPVLERLLPAERPAARLAGVLLALSPILLCLAGAYMSHTTVAALAALSAYAALRAGAGSGRAAGGWAALAGAAAGAMVATRPLAGVTLGAVTTLGIWAGTGRGWPGAARLGALAAGALAPLACLAAYNGALFGSPFRFGYTAALGPATALGFHQDPWGNLYGPLQALAYTSSDLLSLGLYLLETPVSAVALVGLWLVTAARLTGGARVLLAWALLPVAANALYWHHGLFMGPRMLAEAAPAWVALAVLAGKGLVQATPAALRGGSFSPRVALAATLLLALVLGVAWAGPRRALSYRGSFAVAAAAGVAVPAPALVFVHGGWTGRVAALLAARGLRADSVETALRQNATCDVQGALAAGTSRLDLSPRATRLPPQLELSPGNRIRVRPGAPLPAECRRQAAADRLGVEDVAPWLWRGDLPGLPAGAGGAPDAGIMYVRDLGPGLDAELLRRHPGRRGWVLLPGAAGAPSLIPFQEGMRVLWGSP